MKNFTIGRISDIPIYLNLTLVLFLPVLAWLISRPEQIDVYADLIESLAGHSIDRAALAGGDTPLLIGAAGAVTGAGVVSAIQVLQGVGPATKPDPESPEGYV